MKILHNIIALTLTVAVSSCSDDEPGQSVDIVDDNTEYEQIPDLKSDGEVCNLKTANIAANIPDYLAAQVATRFISATNTIGEETRVVLASTSQLTGADENILNAYQNGATIVLVDTDKKVLLQWLDKHGIDYGGNRDDFSDLHLIYAFNNRHRYLLFDDMEEIGSETELAMLPLRFDSVIDWLNKYATEDVIKDNKVNSRAGDVYDITRTFGSQVVTHNFAVTLKDKELAHVIGSNRDRLSKSSSIDVTFTIYPLYSVKSNGSSAGDYYIVQGYVNAHNAGMYNGKWTKKHGGVHARLCGFYMSKLMLSARIETNGLSVKFPVGGTPVPQTTMSSTSYTSGFSWSIGGSINGKYEGGKPGVDVGVSGSCSWNNSETRTLADVSIQRDTPNGSVNWTYTFNNLPHKSGGSKYLTVPDLAKSDFESNHTWIWWIPDTKEGNNTSYKAYIKIDPEYMSYKWYSSAADFGTKTWNDGIKDSEKTFSFHLVAPQRKGKSN